MKGLKCMNISTMTVEDLETIRDTLTTNFDDFWNYQIFKQELENKNSKYLVIKEHDEIIGFAGIKIIIDEADIMNIVVKKSHRNQGIGSILLQNLIDLATKTNLNSLTLEVNEKNFPAIYLYEKFGFKKISTRKKYYKNDDGIVMQINIKGQKSDV